jgi:SAM-dependent methyltransferase
MMGVGAEWEPDAENWVRWARTPGFDAYWHFRDAFFDAIVPRAGHRTLEIGCGEGRVSRDLAARGHSVVALDTAVTLLGYAKTEEPHGAYVVAAGAELPFPNGAFDIVVAYNALQVVHDMPGTVHEAARVLAPGGWLCACVAHPVTDLGRVTAEGDAEPRLTVRDDYFESRRVEDRVEVGDQTMTFRGWTYSLEHYARALEGAGFRVEVIREPIPTSGTAKYDQWRRVPLFLNFRAIKSESCP